MPRTPFASLRSWLKSPAKPICRKAHLRLLNLEDRAVPTAVASFAGGVLTVTGDSGDDDLSIELVSGKVDVFQNATTSHDLLTINSGPVGGLTLAKMTKAVVNTGDGDNTVYVSPAITKPVDLEGGSGDDNLTGGNGNDTINGGDGVDSLNGGAGNDTITGGNGDGVSQGDIINGGAGNDSIIGGSQGDQIYGGFGNDTIHGGDGDDLIRGDDPTDKKGGNDVIFGEGGDDIITGGKGNDTIDGGTGNDTIEAGDGNDNVIGGPESDNAFTGPDDPGAGASDMDVIYGGNGNDSIRGGWGDDLIYGEAGNDTLVGGVGQDTLSGGLGTDYFTGHGVTLADVPNSGAATDEGNFDTYQDEFDLTKPVLGKTASVKSIAPTELGIQGVLAGLAAVANNQKQFNIASRIRYLGSGDYLVKLGPDDDINPDPSNPNPFGWVAVHFDGTWTDNDPMPSALQRFPKAKASPEFWTILIDRALVESFNGSYDPFVWYDQASYEGLDARLTDPGAVIQQLTGNGETVYTPLSPEPAGFTFNDIKANLALGFWLTATVSATPPLAGLAANQSYAIVKVASSKTGNFITLYNPSGFDKGTTASGTIDTSKPADDGFITLSEADFFANFATGYVN